MSSNDEVGSSTLVWKKEKLNPPPPPPKDKKKPKRKTISIQFNEWVKWDKLKGNMTWTLILRDARIAYESVQSMRKQITKLNDTLGKIALENAKLLAHGAPAMGSIPLSSESGVFSKRSIPIQKSRGILKKDDPKSQLLAEIKQLQQDTDDIRSILKPMSKEELCSIQLSEEELVKRMESKS